jgi:hypothetical protein
MTHRITPPNARQHDQPEAEVRPFPYHAPRGYPCPPEWSDVSYDAPVDAQRVPPDLRRDLLRYLAATSGERARLIRELVTRNPGMADLLIELESDEALRVRFEVELLRGFGVSS